MDRKFQNFADFVMRDFCRFWYNAVEKFQKTETEGKKLRKTVEKVYKKLP